MDGNTMNAATAPLAKAMADTWHEVRRDALPLSCPTPSMVLWNSHPRVYLPVEDNGGRAVCPYCGSQFVLVD